MKPILLIFTIFLCLLSPATPIYATGEDGMDREAGAGMDTGLDVPTGPMGEGDNPQGENPGNTNTMTTVTVDLSPIQASLQEGIHQQEEALTVLKSTNTLLLLLALFELFRFARGMSKQVLKKGVTHG